MYGINNPIPVNAEIEEFNLPVGPYLQLKRAGIDFVWQALVCTRKELQALGLSERNCDIVRAFAHKNGRAIVGDPMPQTLVIQR